MVSEKLLSGNQKGLAAQAMRELAHVCFHMGNTRGAFKWWTQTLDTLLNTKGKKITVK